jgi:hypothetical protein
MEDELRSVLAACWLTDPDGPALDDRRICRWCRRRETGDHDPNCPIPALATALDQRDALARYIRTERRNLTLQGAVRLAKKPDKATVRRKLEKCTLELEVVLGRLRELGISEMIR